MTDNDSLLSFVARRHTQGLEDVATDALSFILMRSDSARGALSEFLGDDGDPLPIAKANTQAFLESSYAYPDMALYDSGGAVSAYVESKFWAPLTHNQPVTYWEALPKNRRTVLLFVAPQSRVDEGSLWDELVSKLREAGHQLEPAPKGKRVIAASPANDQGLLMLTSWDLLLERMAERAKRDGNAQAGFEIAELRALAAAATEGGRPGKDENLRQLIADAVARLRETGWANTDGYGVGKGFGYYGRYMGLAGANAWLGIVDEATRQMPDKPLWLSFWTDSDEVSLDVARTKLNSKVQSLRELHDWMAVSVPIAFPEGADGDATLAAIVTELESIAKLIDSDGPTYR